MDFPHVGEAAAFATACCWAVTALAFESPGRRVGSRPGHLIRLIAGWLLFAVFTTLHRGLPFPSDAPASAWLWLGISGLIGFSFGDLCLFRAFVLIGSRLAVLLMSLVPPITALIGWGVLGEAMSAREWLGMAMTVGGVMWVVRERVPDSVEGSRHPSTWGVMLGIGGALGQAVGLVLSKLGMGDYDAFASNQIRVLAGIVGFAAIFTASGLWRR